MLALRWVRKWIMASKEPKGGIRSVQVLWNVSNKICAFARMSMHNQAIQRGEKEARKIGNIVSTIIDLSCFNIPRSIHYSFGLCSCVACQKLIWIYHDTFSILIDRFYTALHCNITSTASEKKRELNEYTMEEETDTHINNQKSNDEDYMHN